MCLALYPSLASARPKLGSLTQLGSPDFRRLAAREIQKEVASVLPRHRKERLNTSERRFTTGPFPRSPEFFSLLTRRHCLLGGVYSRATGLSTKKRSSPRGYFRH